MQIVVLAKRPAPGRVKTRLTPPFTPDQAAALAAASLTDTLDAVGAAPVAARALAFDEDPDGWLRPGYDLVEQVAGGLGDRLAGAVRDAYALCGLPLLLVGMDTPQLTPRLLAAAARRLLVTGVDAVLGPATDGGYWAIGFRTPRDHAFAGVPMSTPATYRAQRRRLWTLGLRVDELHPLTDVDDVATARGVAASSPHTRFARLLADLDPAEEGAA
ncbi:MAG: DUF2064 domain-containing protein [Streptosporangiales bacterium]|nr:DUF2064 domain-containing protein [Streptosporangiales bacterium]